MRTFQSAKRMLAATFGTVGVAFALAASAATFTERSNDRIDLDRDRQATVPAEPVSERDASSAAGSNPAAERARQSNTESGIASDRQFAERVQAALDGDSELKDAFLRVDANNGRVRVNGMVATTSQRDRAIETASFVQGVAGVDDGITLRQPPQFSGSR